MLTHEQNYIASYTYLYYVHIYIYIYIYICIFYISHEVVETKPEGNLIRYYDCLMIQS